jgi:ParB family chromosome partitioning protein
MQPAPEDFAADFARHGAAKPKPARGRPSRASALMRLDLFNGAVSCTAAPGKLELRLDRDFTKIPRARLETAISAFIAALT